jgi:hypothetical protein
MLPVTAVLDINTTPNELLEDGLKFGEPSENSHSDTSVDGVVIAILPVEALDPKKLPSVVAVPLGSVPLVKTEKLAVSPDQTGFKVKLPSVKSSVCPYPKETAQHKNTNDK